ncbi:MAG TPA: VWA domain-containing protein [Thermoanaerobaculia bacterium]|nr:VWA domain-containing protein [Thermoanaerobaculia bacterium]
MRMRFLPSLPPRRATRLLAAALLLAFLRAGGEPDVRPAFRLQVPEGMATGRVLLKARAEDPRITNVIWTLGGVSRRAARPEFDADFDVGPIPQEKRIVAVALDQNRQALYQQEAILNPGERFVGVEILSPYDGQGVSGPVRVLVQARVPEGDAIESFKVQAGSQAAPLAGDGALRSAVVNVPDRTTPISVFLSTASGRRAEKAIVLNGRGIVATSEARIVEQVVGVYRGNEPLEGLTAGDFSVSDGGGRCEIREVNLLRDTPLAVGLLVDTSQSLMYVDALKQATAHLFIERTLKRQDQAFLLRFGPAAVRIVAWTRSREILRQSVLALEDDPVPGTLLNQAVIRGLYQFQGNQGARALLLITDGNAYEDEVPESAALDYARQSGVKIYALALPSTGLKLDRVLEKDEEGTTRERYREVPIEQPPNLKVLERFAEATGGRMYPVKRAADLPRYYEQIERDIRTQYLVSYVANVKRTGSFHAVEVRTRRGRVQTSPGFFY